MLDSLSAVYLGHVREALQGSVAIVMHNVIHWRTAALIFTLLVRSDLLRDHSGL